MFLRTRSVLLVLLMMTCLQSYTASNNEFMTHFCLTVDEPVHSDFSTVQGTTPTPEKADGHWNEWGEWSKCESPNQRTITCKNRMGYRRRLRDCVGREYEGKYCDGEGVDFSRCYDINGCPAGPKEQILGAAWSEWSIWSYCKPDCGEDSTQTRKRVCEPDILQYSEKNREMFTGKPDIDCGPLANTEETRPCLNLSLC